MTRFCFQEGKRMVMPHLLVLLFFLAVSAFYFAPVMDGMEIRQGDVEKFLGMSQELREYYRIEGKSSAWTGSMFSGMPAYTIGIWGDVQNPLDLLEKPFQALGYGHIGIVFMSMLSSYILLLLLGADIAAAAFGALAFSFSSYSLIILEAGHITKAWAMAYMPLVFAGFLSVLRARYLSGGLLFALALALEIKSNHIQITYYLALFCLIIFVGWCIRTFREKGWRPVSKAFMVLAVGVILAALCNSGRLYANYESAQESIRGKSELSSRIDGKTDKSGGLDRDYAFAWSYGIGESFTVLVPDFYGGASGGTLDADSHLAKALQAHGYQNRGPVQTFPYWGSQPFTSGPVYFGAVVCFLFVLAFVLIRNPMKWWYLGAVVFFFLLSWGGNFPGFNDLFFHYFPFYNKFRTVSMALVIPQFIFMLMAVWVLIEIFQKGVAWDRFRRPFLYALGTTGGLCLFLALFRPGHFTSLNDLQMGVPDWYLQALIQDRADLMRSDALRSLAFILAAAACLWIYVRKRGQGKASGWVWVLALLVLADLWNVDRRYLNREDFVPKNTSLGAFRPTKADRAILTDRDPSYRVLSLNNPFNDSQVSYLHKSIGGYSAVKLRRYQELIDLKILPELDGILKSFRSGDEARIRDVFTRTPVLNMLNTRYLIFDVDQPPLKNSDAWGNAWFVDEVRMVEDADEEMSSLSSDARHVAWVDKRFSGQVRSGRLAADSSASITLTSYSPDRLEYTYDSRMPGVVVFSEIYYPHGWKATVDGHPVGHFRTNWILRGMEVPAGKHRIEFRFEPDAYYTARDISIAVSYILVILLAGACIRMAVVRMRRKGED